MDITAANAVITLTAVGVFNTPQQLIGFSADNVYETSPIAVGESSMGVDGLLSSGFVYTKVPQNFEFQADSPSIVFFETVYLFEQQNRAKVMLQGVTTLTAVREKWVMTRGFLEEYSPMPAAAKTLRPRRFGVVWQSCLPQPA